MKTPRRTREKAPGREKSPPRRAVRKPTRTVKRRGTKKAPDTQNTHTPYWRKTPLPKQHSNTLETLELLLNHDYPVSGKPDEFPPEDDDYDYNDEDTTSIPWPVTRDYSRNKDTFYDTMRAQLAEEFDTHNDATLTIEELNAIVTDTQTIKIYEQYPSVGWREGPWWAVLSTLVKSFVRDFKTAAEEDHKELFAARETYIKNRATFRGGLVNVYIDRVVGKGLLKEPAKSRKTKKIEVQGTVPQAKTIVAIEDKISPLEHMSAVLGDE